MEYHGVKTRTLWGPGWVSLPRTHQSTSDKPVAVVVGGEKEVLMCLHCIVVAETMILAVQCWTRDTCLLPKHCFLLSRDFFRHCRKSSSVLQVAVKLGVLKSVWCIVQMKTQRNAFMSVVWKQN